MSDLGSNLDQQSYHARADRRYAQGLVIAVDPIQHTCTLDVGATDVGGNPVTLDEVPFQPQMPPSVGDNVGLVYANASPHSVAVAGGALSGQNAQGSLQVVGAVTSLTASGGGAALQGAIVIAGAGSCSVTESGQTITVTGGGGISGVSAESGGGSAVGPEAVLNFVAGTGIASVTVSDNTSATPHRIDVTVNAAAGVSSYNGGTGAVTGVGSLNSLTGAVTIAAGSNISLGVSGSTITINAAALMSGVDIGSGGGTAVGPQQVINFINGGNMSIGVANNTGAGRLDVTLTNTASGGGVPVWPVTVVSSGTTAYTALSTDVVLFCFTETTAQVITLPSAVGMAGKIYEIFDAYQGSTQGITVAATGPSVVLGITSIRNGSGGTARLSVRYISDGTNWHSVFNSSGN